MSVKREYETKTYTKTEEVMTSEKRYCDICKREITDHYWRVRTGHYDWGNDSCESVECFDICSDACLQKVFNKYIENSNVKDRTQYLEIEHKRNKGVKGEIKYD